MEKIAVDAEMLEKLYDLRRPMELCDEAGNVLGRFLPVVDRAEFVPSEPRISEEEIQRRRQQKATTFTTAEVLERLENA